jgi:hypothetical protein
VSGFSKEMNKLEALKELNKKIDKLIINGKENTKEFKRLCKMHLKVVLELGVVIKSK